ncbi:MAG: DUF2089 family protein [Candidatus Omnitrophica bacterium]|nr:DUF2089 family protein [Candidatus Omnitrophota bacterium]
MDNFVSSCPVCGKNLKISRLICESCRTSLEGRFNFTRLGSLPLKDQGFIETFLRCRGNIKEAEKILGVSYPTVCKRLEEINNKIKEAGYTKQR